MARYGSDDDDKEEKNDLDAVVGKLQNLHQQLQVLTHSQQSVEAYVKKIYQEVASKDPVLEVHEGFHEGCGGSRSSACNVAPLGQCAASWDGLCIPTGHAVLTGNWQGHQLAKGAALRCNQGGSLRGAGGGIPQHRLEGSARESVRKSMRGLRLDYSEGADDHHWRSSHGHRHHARISETHCVHEDEHHHQRPRQSVCRHGSEGGRHHAFHGGEDGDYRPRASTSIRHNDGAVHHGHRGSSVPLGRNKRPSEEGVKDKPFWARREMLELQKMSFQASRSISKSLEDATEHASPDELPSSGTRFLMHPDSWNRAFFDTLSVVILLYESVMIPYVCAFPIPFDGWYAVVSWLTAVFWAVDMLLGFFTGYYEKERAVLKMRKICWNYLKTGFFPNLFLVTVDIGGLLFEESMMNNVTTRREVKIALRLLRFVKLQRIATLNGRVRQGKIGEAVDEFNTFLREQGWDDEFEIIITVAKLLFYILWVIHVFTCMWCALATSAIDKWQIDFSVTGGADEAFNYMLGLYWTAIILISGGSMMIPTSNVELLLTVFSVVFGFIFTSVLISSLLSGVIAYQEVNKDRIHKLSTLRQFLHQNKVRAKTAAPIVKQVMQRMARRKRLQEGDVEALTVVSPSLHSELWYSIYGPNLAQHEYFNACRTIEGGLIKSLCFSALSHKTYQPGDLVFEPEEAEGTYYVCHGTLDYRSLNNVDFFSGSTISNSISGSADTPPSQTFVDKGAWISEVAIWANWMHRGWLEALTTCELLTIQSESLVKVMGSHPKLISVVQSYCTCMLAALEQEPVEALTDLSIPISHSSIVAAMPLEFRKKFSEGAVLVMQKNRISTTSGEMADPDDIEELKEEYARGECDIRLDGLNKVTRMVSLVAVRLVRWHDGAVLAQIGEIRGEEMVGKCQPPSTKLHMGEYPRQALDRMLENELKPIATHIEFGGHSEDCYEEAAEEEHTIATTYARTLFQAELDEIHVGENYMRSLRRVSSSGAVVRAVQHLPPRRSLASRVSLGGGMGSTTSFGSRASKANVFLNRVNGLLGRKSTTSSAGMGDLTVDRTNIYQAFVFRSHLEEHLSTVPIYAWLVPEDFELLCGEEAKVVVQNWVAQLAPAKDVEEEEEEEAEHSHNHNHIRWALEPEDDDDDDDDDEQKSSEGFWDPEEEEEGEDGENPAAREKALEMILRSKKVDVLI